MAQIKQALSNFQITAIVTINIIGLLVLSLPRIAAEIAGVDGVLVTFLSGILSLLMASIIILLCKRFPNLTIIEFSQIILGKFLGRLFGAAFTLYSLMVASVILRGFADAMKVLLLPRTPLEFIMITMLLVTLYSVQGGISSIAKISEIFLSPILIVIGLLILFNLNDVDMFRFRSIFSNGLKPIIIGIPSVYITYLGYEVIYFLFPFTKNKGKLFKYSAAGFIAPIFIYTSLVFVTIGISGAKTTAKLVYPTIQLARRIVFPGSFIERFDIFFIIFWILAVFTTINIYLYMASISVTRLIGLRNYKPFAFMLGPFVYIIAILPQNIIQINLLSNAANYAGILMIFTSIPILLISVIRKKGGKNNG